jgi:hypothetical protein
MSRISSCANSILALAHPELYSVAAKGLESLRKRKETGSVARFWTTVFTGIAAISNRLTRQHIDKFGHFTWYDLLISVGTYKHATLIMHDLGATFEYNSGTAVLLCGRLLKHEVPFWGSGDRVCWAYFMRKAVLERLGVLDRVVGWSTQQQIRKVLDNTDT